ncbi:MAG: plasmid stabilization protein [Hyphomicrobiales bacterium]
MTDLLIRKLDPVTKRRLQDRARKSGKSLSDEAKELLRTALTEGRPERPVGTALLEHFKGLGPVELDLPRRDEMPRPPGIE